MCCPFSLCETCQIYVLRIYIRVWNFQLPILLYDLIWEDVMYILGQALTPASTTWVWKAVAYGDEWLGKESLGKRKDVPLFSSFNMENGVADFISNLASLWFRRVFYFQNWKVKIVYCGRQNSGSQKCSYPYHWNPLLYYLTWQKGHWRCNYPRILG